MKHALSAIAVFFLVITYAGAEEAMTQPVKADDAPDDCSKQVWPNFSPSCLRNADRTINVRLVTVNRR
jgi:hypothetical protein